MVRICVDDPRLPEYVEVVHLDNEAPFATSAALIAFVAVHAPTITRIGQRIPVPFITHWRDSVPISWHAHSSRLGKDGIAVEPITNTCGKESRDEISSQIIDHRLSTVDVVTEKLRNLAGIIVDEPSAESRETTKQPIIEEPRINLPLAESPNERARRLTNLDERFLVVPDETMNRHAAAYVRKHPFLTEDVCREHRCGIRWLSCPHKLFSSRSSIRSYLMQRS